MSETVKLLLVGIGGYGAGYVMTALNMEDEFEVVGVADPYAENSPAFDSLEDVPVFETIEDFFAAGHTADAAVISTPIHLHCKHLVSALSNGMHVLCEKPLCASPEEAQAMIAAAAAHPDKKVLIGFQWSFSPAILQAKQQILDGVWGKPLEMRVTVRWPRAFSYYERNDWAGRIRDTNGNAVGDSVLSNATAHYLHNPLFMLGDTMDQSSSPATIEAECFRAFDIETFDTAFVRLRVSNAFNAETTVYIAVSHCSEESADPVVEYTFENGKIWCAGDDRLHGELNGNPVEFGIIGSNLEGYYNKMNTLFECITEDAASPCTAQTAMPEFEVAHHVITQIPVRTFISNHVEECTASSREKRLKVNGLDAVMIECTKHMKLPSEIGARL